MKKIYMLFVALIVVATSCNKFLEEPASKASNIKPTTVEHLESLLDNYTLLAPETDVYPTYGSDDMRCDVSIMDDKIEYINIEKVRFHLWDKDLATKDTKLYSWSEEWTKVFLANSILYFLPRVTGSEKQKEQLRLEAHFMRAYSYMKLINTFCLPAIESNMKELGLPIKASTSFAETDTRATLGETLAFIESDLDEALKIVKKIDKNSIGVYNSWRASKGGAYALCARYWLMRGDYTKAENYADLSLKEHNVLVDYNTDMHLSTLDNKVTVGGITYTLNYPYTYDNYPDMLNVIKWPEFLYLRILQEIGSWFIPSESLLNCYDKDNDLRYKYHFVDNYSFVRGFQKHNVQGYIFFFFNAMPSGLSVGEMVLTKAECQARLGNVNEAIKTVNILRNKRMLPGNELSAANKEDAVKKILEERRREMPFSIRWFDLRRLNHNTDTYDDIIISKTFFPYSISLDKTSTPIEYKLEKGSKHYAYPIPDTDIQATGGKLQQNIY